MLPPRAWVELSWHLVAFLPKLKAILLVLFNLQTPKCFPMGAGSPKFQDKDAEAL